MRRKTIILIGGAAVLAAVAAWIVGVPASVRPAPGIGEPAPSDAGAATASTAADRERTAAGPRPQVAMILIDEETSAPVAGAVVYYISDGNGDAGRAESGADGVARIAAAGRGAAYVMAPSYCNLIQFFDDAASPGTVRLQRAGRLQLTVVDAAGAPISGVAVALRMPSQAPIWTLASSDPHDLERVRATDSVRRWIEQCEGRIGSRDREAAERRLEALRRDFGPDAPRSGDDALSMSERAAFVGMTLDRKTDALGRAEWSGLPASDHYRWRRLGDVPLEIEPRLELFGEAGLLDKTVQDGIELWRRELSAEFAIAAGASHSIRVRAVDYGDVKGRVDFQGEPPQSPSGLELTDVRWGAGPGGASTAILSDSEATVALGSDGAFEVKHVRPGRKRLTALCEQPKRRFRMLQLEFTLAAGESRDLGTLRFHQGTDVEVRMPCADEAGTEFDAEKVLEPGSPRRLLLQASVDDVDLPFPDRLGALIQVDLGESIVLRGATPTAWTFQTMRLGTEPFRFVRGIEASSPAIPGVERHADLRSVHSVTLPFEIMQAVEVVVRCPFVSGVGSVPPTCYVAFVPIAGATRTSDAPMLRMEKYLQGSAKLAAGKWRLILLANRNLDSPCDWTASAEIDLAPGSAPQIVELVPRIGAVVDGLVVDDRGMAIPNGIVGFTAQPLSPRGARSAQFSARADNVGHFTLRGLPENAALWEITDPSALVTTGGAGSVTPVTVRRRTR